MERGIYLNYPHWVWADGSVFSLKCVLIFVITKSNVKRHFNAGSIQKIAHMSAVFVFADSHVTSTQAHKKELAQKKIE